jgi:hypothetical protein
MCRSSLLRYRLARFAHSKHPKKGNAIAYRDLIDGYGIKDVSRVSSLARCWDMGETQAMEGEGREKGVGGFIE